MANLPSLLGRAYRRARRIVFAVSGDVSGEFAGIYRESTWGGGSGTGARPEHNQAYMTLVQQFIRLNEVKTVVDLGCGDWQFSRFIDWRGVKYVGVDVVPEVVSRNCAAFGSENVSFVCETDPSAIPAGDLLIAKDVFQHLPNKTVVTYLETLRRKFRWLLVTNDDYPGDNLNADILPGAWRALRLDKPPFSLDATALLSWAIVSETPTVRKRTVLIRGLADAASAGATSDATTRA